MGALVGGACLRVFARHLSRPDTEGAAGLVSVFMGRENGRRRARSPSNGSGGLMPGGGGVSKRSAGVSDVVSLRVLTTGVAAIYGFATLINVGLKLLAIMVGFGAFRLR